MEEAENTEMGEEDGKATTHATGML